MPQIDSGLLPRMLWLVAVLASTFCTKIVCAAPPVDEIRTILSKRALRPILPSVLSALDANNLDAGLRVIDPYARYVPISSPLIKINETLQLGIEVFAYNSRLWIRPDPRGPASQAGIPEIGVLQAVNGKKVMGTDLEQIPLLNRGGRKGDVSLTVSNKLGSTGKTYRVRPGAFSHPSITWRRSGIDVVIRISEFFSHDTAPGLSARLAALVRSGDRVVLDLRGCSGGDLFEALEIAGMFVPSGLPLVSTYDRTGKIQIFRSPSRKKKRSPFLLLIDRRTASAAEILAGVLQYYHLATLVGERTYGKCVSQTLVPLSDGGGLWFTTLGINFPDSSSCTGGGIVPNIPYPDVSVAKVSDITKQIPIGRH